MVRAQDPFAFAKEPKPTSSVRRRFLGGTSAIAFMYHALEGVSLLLDAGLEEVRKDSLAKTASCVDKTRELGLRL